MSEQHWQPIDYVLATLQRGLGGRQQTPAPMPAELLDAARWWLLRMSEPKRSSETSQSFGQRCAYALNGWLMLNAEDRKRVVGLVQQGVAYHGDRIDAYLLIARETQRMREQGADTYREHALRKSAAYLQRIAA
jgi:hypothetical protein